MSIGLFGQLIRVRLQEYATRLYIFIFIHQKTVEKKNNTKTIKRERKANNLTKQIKIY